MNHRPWLTYVHRFGYFTTFIFVLSLLFLSYVGITDWIRREARREYTRMQQGPATERLGGVYGGRVEKALLNQLPPLSALSPDGMRLVATPSFGDTYFSLSLRRTPAGAEGLILMAGRNTESNDLSPARSVPIKLTPTAYKKLTSDLDMLASSWRGEDGFTTDGTGIVIERVRNGKVSSGFGNSFAYYGRVGALVFDAVRPVTPQLARFGNDWHPHERDSASKPNGS